MKAIAYNTYGPPDVLHVAEVPKPTPKDNEILIKVRAAEATKTDCEMRSLKFSVKWFAWPMRLFLGVIKPKNPILGGYFSGEVVAVGKDVTKFKPGDEIFGNTGFTFGAYGEYLCLPDKRTLALKPKNISFAEAAAVPLGGFNALHFMRKAKIKPNEMVLVNGAGGSIGLFGVQIAKSMGAKVTGVDHTIKLDLLRQAGADHVVDYTSGDFFASGERYDVIFDMVAGSSYAGCIAALNPGGRYLKGNPRFADMLRSVGTNLFSKKSASFAFANETQEELLALAAMLKDGQITSIVDKVFPMEQAAEAHRLVETEQRLGMIVIKMDQRRA